MDTSWHPSWWNDADGSTWDRAREAVRRDWEQTKHDLHLEGGHELNQSVGHTVRQAFGKDRIAPNARPNPAKVIGDWDDVDLPVGYGYGARRMYGVEHPTWDADVESTLRTEWESNRAAKGGAWEDVKVHVRHGYEFEPRS